MKKKKEKENKRGTKTLYIFIPARNGFSPTFTISKGMLTSKMQAELHNQPTEEANSKSIYPLKVCYLLHHLRAG